MNTEQKAKAYDETISKLQSLINNANKQGHIIIRVEELENTFPELKDERMREMAIKAIHAPQAQSCIKSWGINPDDVIAWLEKIGTSYTKRDVDDAYLKGISDAKNEIEKQCEPNATSINKEKPTWTEGDENIKQWIISDIEKLFSLNKKSDIISKIEMDWLKSLKDRIGG